MWHRRNIFVVFLCFASLIMLLRAQSVSRASARGTAPQDVATPIGAPSGFKMPVYTYVIRYGAAAASPHWSSSAVISVDKSQRSEAEQDAIEKCNDRYDPDHQRCQIEAWSYVRDVFENGVLLRSTDAHGGPARSRCIAIAALVNPSASGEPPAPFMQSAVAENQSDADTEALTNLSRQIEANKSIVSLPSGWAPQITARGCNT